jgi:hypothetical protein
VKIHPSITEERVIEAAQRDDGTGFCIKCGVEHDYCEPDMHDSKCDACDEFGVYGAEELIFHIA